jgi:hypothetical protein
MAAAEGRKRRLTPRPSKLVLETGGANRNDKVIVNQTDFER